MKLLTWLKQLSKLAMAGSIKCCRKYHSPLEIRGVDTSVTHQEVIDSIRIGRDQDIRERRDSSKLG